MIKRLSVITITIWFMWACLPSFVSAHAYLSHSTPLQDAELQASPEAIKLTFTEKIDSKLSSVTLTKASDGSSIAGKLSADGEMTLVNTIPKLESGEYKVVWQVLSLDTHITDGSFRFAIGGKLTQTKPDETASLDGGGQAGAGNGQGSTDGGGEKPSASSKPLPTAKPKPTPSDTIDKDVGVSAKPSATSPPKQNDNTSVGSAEADGQETGSAIATGTPQANGDTNSEPTSTPPSSEPTAPLTSTSSAEADTSEIEQEMLGTDTEDGDGEHNHAGGQKLMSALRVADVLVSAILAALLFFRYCIWRDYAEDAPPGFTLRAERIVMAVAVAVWLATGIWRLTMLSNDLGGIPIGQIANGTMVGKIAVLRPLAAVLLLLLAFAPVREQRFANIVKAAAAAATIVTFPLTSHAYAELTDAGLAILAHAVHMGSAAIWLGGLAGLAALTYRRQAAAPLKISAERFAAWALPSMMLIIVSGVWLSVKQLDSWKQLITEDYGNLILIKSGLLLLVLVLAALHRLVFMPKLAQAEEAGGGKAATALRGLLIGVRIEILLAVALFLLAGMLSTTSPPSAAAEQSAGIPLYWHVMGEQAHMTLRIDEDSDSSSSSQKAILYLWLPEDSGPPSKINVSTAPQSDGEPNSQQLQTIPFEPQPADSDADSYPGFVKYTYKATGALIDVSVNNVITVDVIDGLGHSIHFERETSS
ncbi:copper resistance CopC/CopD family protein [Paenibacillus sp. YIM B09110]|uniref:copper resistance CopC/CopD family protein n=1 Tax=Paenibacillus sp. YIM B09110 TaxID=3126102 RepID=UPI00301C620B